MHHFVCLLKMAAVHVRCGHPLPSILGMGGAKLPAVVLVTGRIFRDLMSGGIIRKLERVYLFIPVSIITVHVL